MVLVIGNEKGGTGKSTIAMHIAVYIMKLGLSVATVDLDARQGTLSRYIHHRSNNKSKLMIPNHYSIYKENDNADRENLDILMKKISSHDAVIIDTPGNDTALSQHAHYYADIVITPLNDSFLDLEMLVRIDGDEFKPSVYAEMVWEQRKKRIAIDGKSIEWIIIRNRLSNLYTKNKEEVDRVLRLLSKRIGFRIAPGLSERVIFRELFLSGLTLLDFAELNLSLTPSHYAAQRELEELLSMIKYQTIFERKKLA
jgi:chromosome partitioning protein